LPYAVRDRRPTSYWYAARFGFEVAPLASATDGVATWPEPATAVAVRLDDHDEVEATAVQGGVDDLT
jgi:hypothetical protein